MQYLWDGIQQAFLQILSGDHEVMQATLRTIWISGTAVLAASVFGIPIGMCLARTRFPLRHTLLQAFRIGMALPTVFIGIICFAMFSRQAPLGPLNILYTPWAIMVGEFLLALPIIVSLTQGAIQSLDRRISETAKILGAGRLLRWRTFLSEARIGISLAILTAFSRCVTELGIAMMVGGNIKDRTRTLSTATAMETGKGEFSDGLAMGVILLGIAMIVTLTIGRLIRDDE
ncbi:ABC transporter permease [Mariniblastus sp.]|jgi:tungstate transport system permease protein|nr:ABC transporter permease [Mariniblastus sp.]MDB4756542.1 ABC transporter permease [Mariniblastus sp.]